MEGMIQDPSQPSSQPQPPQQNQAVAGSERLNKALQQQLNLESLKTRAISLFKAITRILEDFDAYSRTNTTPKWQDILGQYSMVNLELFNIVDEIKKVSKAFVVHPKNVNAENAPILPVMLSSKLLPEMEVEDNLKREQLLQGMQNLPIPSQIDKLKARIDMIAAACDSAEKVLADTRKAYCFGSRQVPAIHPTLDKGQAAKIQEQENLLRAAVNFGEGLRLPADQKQITPSLPLHLVDIMPATDGVHSFTDSSGMYMKNSPLMSNNMGSQGSLLQATGAQLISRSAASPAATSATSFDNTTTSPLPYANSPRSGTTMMNTPSPQQQTQQLQQQQHQQQQRQKMMQLPQHQQQLLAQQQFRQSAMQGLGQNQLPLHDLQGQTQQKFQSLHGQMQFSQPLGHQQFQGRQLPPGHVQHGIGQSQLNQGNQLSRHLGQFSSPANTALFNAAQGTPSTQMIPNMSATMSSQSLLPRMQYGLPGSNPQRTHGSQILSDQMFNMGSNPGGLMGMQPQQQQQQQQQQQHGAQGAFGNMGTAQNLQSNMVALQNNPNFAQQRQQNQQ
ncbi:Mediator of RNA polymerase II transcription subunit 8 [Hibiscus syriacus]|uniref:Mediator of RNA polymerase II transcription subunit 8 n=1 Tax=Hibiscus syriacus TaxID=106335 RepID=A0A6A3D8Y7_HIBSY|nr:mediator of RNA polymerase II transcription subunit 8-like [Hibiscus syriacus]KAE8735659.1 Mediator of RNA polymerase II transcription subunit 8 [Hibiscus syriacus]